MSRRTRIITRGADGCGLGSTCNTARFSAVGELLGSPAHPPLADMRDHLQTMGDIQGALSKGSFDKTSELAEQRLGMSSLETHGAYEVAKYMPAGMQDARSAMHHSASQFALVAKDASVTGDLKAVLASLHHLNQTCVACRAAFRLQ